MTVRVNLYVLGVECAPVVGAEHSRAGIVAREWAGEVPFARVVVTQLKLDRGWCVEVNAPAPVGEAWTRVLAGHGQTFGDALHDATEMRAWLLRTLEVVAPEGSSLEIARQVRDAAVARERVVAEVAREEREARAHGGVR